MKSDELIDIICQTMIEKKITLYKIARLTGLSNLYNTSLKEKLAVLSEQNKTKGKKHHKNESSKSSINLNTLVLICEVLDLDIIIQQKK